MCVCVCVCVCRCLYVCVRVRACVRVQFILRLHMSLYDRMNRVITFMTMFYKTIKHDLCVC